MSQRLRLDLHPANLCSSPTVTHSSCWLHKEGLLARIVPVHQESVTLHMGKSEPL